MVVDADAQRAALRAYNEIEGNASFKMTNDPRVTRVGRFLRKTSIDELPQLWNVLRGEMSLVGPRPHPFDDVAGYDDWHRRRLSMRPGITGLWQIGGRRETSFDRWVEKDLEYIDRWSLWLDFRVIAATIPASSAQKVGNPSEHHVAVIGCGHVGLVMAAGLAKLGHQVVGVDRSEALVGQLCSGEVIIRERGLPELVQ